MSDEKKFKVQTVKERPAQSALERDVPKRTDNFPINDPNCWHCGLYPKLESETGAIVWCARCYTKLYEKMNGKYIQHDSVPALKKLLEDQKDGKLKDVPLASIEARTKYIKE